MVCAQTTAVYDQECAFNPNPGHRAHSPSQSRRKKIRVNDIRKVITKKENKKEMDPKNNQIKETKIEEKGLL